MLATLYDFLSEHLIPSFYILILLISLSLICRQLLISIGQIWIKTISQTLTILLLPIIVFTITKVISGNLALSLGMVGALSIVRFRNPVRSPLELSVYFFSIASGIIGAANPMWLLVLISGSAISIFLVYVLSKIFNKSFLSASFYEGNIKSILEVSIKGEVDIEKIVQSSDLLGDIILLNFSEDSTVLNISTDDTSSAIKCLAVLKSSFDISGYNIR